MWDGGGGGGGCTESYTAAVHFFSTVECDCKSLVKGGSKAHIACIIEASVETFFLPLSWELGAKSRSVEDPLSSFALTTHSNKEACFPSEF